MAVRLTISDCRNPEEQFERGFNQERILVGRSRSCDICLPDLTVSTEHLEIRLNGHHYVAKDVGSMNGTAVNGTPLVAHRPRRLSNGDTIEMAAYTLTFRLGVAEDPQSPRELSRSHARRMLAAILDDQNTTVCPVLVVVNGPGAAMRFELEPAPSVAIIGRSRQVKIHLDDRHVGRHHAEVRYENGRVHVKNLNTRQGIWVNDEKCDAFTVSQGEQFVVGETTLALEHPMDPSLYAIQSAPEEETASFCMDVSTSTLRDPLVGDDAQQSALPTDTDNDLPVGPDDPLEASSAADYAKTQEIRGLPGDQKSDLGIIVVGAILVTICVSLLIWLLT